MLQAHHLQRETAIQSHQITDNDSLKGIIEDHEEILLELGLQYTIVYSILFYIFKHLFIFNVYIPSLMHSTNNCC